MRGILVLEVLFMNLVVIFASQTEDTDAKLSENHAAEKGSLGGSTFQWGLHETNRPATAEKRLKWDVDVDYLLRKRPFGSLYQAGSKWGDGSADDSANVKRNEEDQWARRNDQYFQYLPADFAEYYNDYINKRPFGAGSFGGRYGMKKPVVSRAFKFGKRNSAESTDDETISEMEERQRRRKIPFGKRPFGSAIHRWSASNEGGDVDEANALNADTKKRGWSKFTFPSTNGQGGKRKIMFGKRPFGSNTFGR